MAVNNDRIEEEKRISVLSKISLVWTVISTVYAIVSTCLFVARGWVSGVASYVLVGVLSLYVIVFIVLIVLTVRNPKNCKRNVGLYKKLLKIFKLTANVVFLVLTAISLASIAVVGLDGVFKWIAFILSFAVALVQLGLKVVLLVSKLARMSVARKFKVEVVSFVDGRKQKKNLRAKLEEKKYRDE